MAQSFTTLQLGAPPRTGALCPKSPKQLWTIADPQLCMCMYPSRARFAELLIKFHMRRNPHEWKAFDRRGLFRFNRAMDNPLIKSKTVFNQLFDLFTRDFDPAMNKHTQFGKGFLKRHPEKQNIYMVTARMKTFWD